VVGLPTRDAFYDYVEEAVVSYDDRVDEMIDEAVEESFPASDPPSWTLGHGDLPPPLSIPGSEPISPREKTV
jgi:hypothetical protein